MAEQRPVAEKLNAVADSIEGGAYWAGLEVVQDLRNLARFLHYGPVVSFYFDDADPVARCFCGWHHHGDAAMDAFGAWWRHLAADHAGELD
jgi:hypothetical protein